MIRLTTKHKTLKGSVIKWKTQAGNISTKLKAEIDFTLPEFSATKIVTWECHEDESDKVRYNMILGRYLLTSLKSKTFQTHH